MTMRRRGVAAAVACAVHLALLVPLVGDASPVLESAFRADAEATLTGKAPYRDTDFEYPPLALPLVLGPAAVSDNPESFATAFAWQMVVADLAIVLLLAFGLAASGRAVGWALGVYTLGIALLTGVGPLPDSALEQAALPLARFDLVPAALVLAAVLARQAGRSLTWGLLLSLGTAVKAFPGALLPVLARGERRPAAAAVGIALPAVAAAVLVLALGDDFSSAIAYHSGRDLQVEALAASPFLLADLLGGSVATAIGGGSWNVVASGAGLARWLSLLAMLAAYVLVVALAWRHRLPLLETATAALAAVVVLAPLLSPQFLLWLLPLSAAAYGRDVRNAILLAAFGLTAWVLAYYGGVAELEPRFVVATVARNLLLAGYLAMVLWPLIGASRRARTREAAAR